MTKPNTEQYGVADCEILAQKLIAQGRLDAARRLLAQQAPEDGLSAAVIRLLATIETGQGNKEAAAKYLAEAFSREPSDADIACEYARALVALERYSEARNVLESVQHGANNASIQADLADLYRSFGWHAHAVACYRSRGPLPARISGRYLKSWILSGGPFPWWRSKAWTREMKADDACEAWLHNHRPVINSIHLERPGLKERIVNDMRSYLLLSSALQLKLERAERFMTDRRRMLGYLFLSWILAALYIRTVWGATLFISTLLIAELSTIIAIPLDGFLRRYIAKGAPYPRWYLWTLLTFFGFVIDITIESAIFAWPSIVLLTLIVTSLTSALWLSPLHQRIGTTVRIRMCYPREAALHDLFGVLRGIDNQEARLVERRRWMTSLQAAAWSIEHFIPRRLFVRDSGIRQPVLDGFRKAAIVVRSIAYCIAVSSQHTWEQLQMDLRNGISAICAEDFGDLRSAVPALPTPVGPSRRYKAMSALAVVACLGFLIALGWFLFTLKNRNAQAALLAASITAAVPLLIGFVLRPFHVEYKPSSENADSTG